MDLIRWDEQYRVGVEMVDEQHRQLFEVINKFVGNFGKNDRSEIEATLAAMVEYTDYHFQAEEQLFRNHPDFAHHQREHAIFLRKVVEFQKNLAAGKEELSLAMVQFLLSWLKNHILTTDIKFFRELRGACG